MCLIVFAWRPGHALPLVVAANRDEFHARPSLPLARWEDAPSVYAGRDLEAGGTWLGIGAEGRFAALTNIRDPAQPLGLRSRGELTAAFLKGDQPPLDYLNDLAHQASEYAGFNLLVGDAEHLCFFNSREGEPRILPAGVYGLSNARLDTPWPKLQRAKQALAGCLDTADSEQLLNLLADPQPAVDAQLPETGVGLATERLLSSVFIAGAHYGTRASTTLLVAADGQQEMRERSFGPAGAQLGEVRLRL